MCNIVIKKRMQAVDLLLFTLPGYIFMCFMVWDQFKKAIFYVILIVCFTSNVRKPFY